MSTDTVDLPEDSRIESLTETVTAKVTRSEKRDVVMVAAFENTDVSKLLRSHSITEILAIARQLREAHREVAA